MKIEFVEITPENAQFILQHENIDNRSESKSHVKWLARQMTDGLWRQDTADPIRFSKSGRLIDGQHRLRAVVESGKAQTFLVVRDLDDSVFSVLDTGKTRTSSDVLSIAKFQNYIYQAALARKILMYNTTGTLVDKGSFYATNAEILDYVTKNDISQYIVFGRACYNDWRVFTITEWAFFYYVFSLKNEAEAEDFLRRLSSGADIPSGSPLHVLRQKLEQNLVGGLKMLLRAKVAFVVIAWNAMRTGKEIKMFKYDPSAPLPQVV